jgi:hypothetical protein
VHPNPGKVRRGHDGGSRRVFRQFAWLEVGSGKVALSRLAHQRVTQAVGQFLAQKSRAGENIGWKYLFHGTNHFRL